MRVRYYNTLVPPDADLSDSIVKARFEALESAAATIWESMNRSADREYIWENDKAARFVPDSLPCGAFSSRVTISFGKLVQLATTYRTKGSQYEDSPELKKEIIAGMEWLLDNRYGPSVAWYDNWWYWVIGTPLNIDNLLVLMYDDLPKELIDKALAAMDFYAPNVTYEGASTGANKIWQCKNMVLRGIISRNAEQIKMGIDGMDTEFKYVATHDGFYQDGSFVQHQWHAYTGGYGRSLLRELTEIIVLVHGSEWEVPQKHRNMLCEWINNAYCPLVYRGALMDMVRGREIARPSSDQDAGHALLISLLRLSEIATEPEKQSLQSFIKGNIRPATCKKFINIVPTYLLAYTRSLLADTTIATEERSLTKIFAAMDCAVHLRPGFAFALRLSSSRIESYESINEENLKGWYIGDGMTYLYDNDLQQYAEFWPSVNAYRMPGTTVDTRLREAKTMPLAGDLLYADGYKSPQDWVGGASICNSYGMVGMWYDADGSSLEAKKSWLMAGDEIAALGAGINSNDRRTIETIVENRKLPNPSCRLIVDDEPVLAEDGQVVKTSRWVCLENKENAANIGYYFPSKTPLNLQRERRTGSWSDINGSYRYAPIERDYLTFWIDHGKSPRNAMYAYVLLPGRDAAATRQYAAQPNVAIIANTPQVQAVAHIAEGVTGLNFWEATSTPVAGVTADAPASVIIKESADEIIIGVSDPTQKGQTVTVTVNRPAGEISLENPDVKVLSTNPLKLEVGVAGAIGATRTVAFKKITDKL